jgi:hypothetical protein
MRPKLTKILDETLEANQMSKEYYKKNKKSRLRNILTIRQVVSLVGQYCGYSLHEIAFFLGKSSGSIHHSKEMAKSFCCFEKEYAKMVTTVMKKLREEDDSFYTKRCKNERCYDCEIFQNHQGKKFLLGFHCPIKDEYIRRDDFVCSFVLSDRLPF